MMKESSLTDRSQSVLDELAAMAMSLARVVGKAAGESAEPDPQMIRSFVQLADTVRRIIALQAKLAGQPKRGEASADPLPFEAPLFKVSPSVH